MLPHMADGAFVFVQVLAQTLDKPDRERYCESNMPTDKPIIGYGNQGYLSCVRASLLAEDDGYCWHDGMFEGTFDHPQQGQFTIRASNIDGYQASFLAGIPGSGGIPIDEIGDHSPDPTGAFGWIEQLRRLPSKLATGIRWTSKGAAVLQDGIFKYISLVFSVDNPNNNPYHEPNVIVSAALTNRPLFWQQGAIQYAAATELSRDHLRQMRDQRAAQFGIEVRKDGRLTPSAQYRELAPRPADYADPVNLKYPLFPEVARLQQAIYFGQSYPHYTDERSRKVVYTRIVRALRLSGQKPPPNPMLDRLLPPDLRAWVAQP